MHKSSLQKMEAFRRRYLTGREREPLRILDVGSQDVNGSYRPIFDQGSWRYVGLDMAPGPNVDLVLPGPYDWRRIPAGSYDVVISGQALEHVEFFWITILEMARVLRPGGLLCVIAPSGGFEHRYPVDCWRFYADGFAALARWARLEVRESWTEWQPPVYGDGSEAWKDSILVAAQPHRPWLARVRRRIREALFLAVLRRALKRRQEAYGGAVPAPAPDGGDRT